MFLVIYRIYNESGADLDFFGGGVGCKKIGDMSRPLFIKKNYSRVRRLNPRGKEHHLMQVNPPLH